jgi:hypothetical protein
MLGCMQGVEGVIIAANDGQIHKSTLNEQLTQEYASQIPGLAALARNVVRDLDPQVIEQHRQAPSSLTTSFTSCSEVSVVCHVDCHDETAMPPGQRPLG